VNAAALPGETKLRSVILPFITFTLIWGSTWIVIRDQLGVVPAQWSITYRFLIAAGAMALWARLKHGGLALPREVWPLAGLIGVFQFSVNFNGVYIAEHFITSGLVATVFALLLIPNSLIGWALLGHRPTRPFVIGSSIAVAGIACLFAEELRRDSADVGAVATGIAWTLVGVLAAALANNIGATDRAQRAPVLVLLAWAMTAGALTNLAVALAIAGPPVIDPRPGYWIGLVYLALAASVLCFALYFPVVRRIGPGKAAYSSALVPIVAMALSTLFEGYRWSPLAALGGALAIGGMVLALTSKKAPPPLLAPAD
jgi:drug/metabolite transporter (DMT)-like permease